MAFRVRAEAVAIETCRKLGPKQVVVPTKVFRPRADVLVAQGHRIVDPGEARQSPLRLAPSPKVPRLADRLGGGARRNATTNGLSADVWVTGSGVAVDMYMDGTPVAGTLTTTKLEHVLNARTGGHNDLPTPTPRSTASYNSRLGPAMQQLAVGIVGAGRQGSLLTLALLAAGIARFVICDADSFDLDGSSEDGHLFARGNRGAPKVFAARKWLEMLGAEARVVDLPLESPEAVQALAGVDLLIYAADLPATAVRCYALSTMLAIPCLILGAGLSPALEARGSVRMLVPGGRCLGCLGGVQLEGVPASGVVTSAILMEQAAAATRLVQRLIVGRERDSTVIELNESNGTVAAKRVPSPDKVCSICTGVPHG